MTETNEIVMPIQPIRDGRFVKNRIVETLLGRAPINMNDIAAMDFTNQERMQFSQLIGYSLGGFSELSYVDDETYEAACNMVDSATEEEARSAALRNQLNTVREGLRIAAPAVFGVHPDDLIK